MSVYYEDAQIASLKRQIRELEDLVEALLISAPQHVLYVTDAARIDVRNGGVVTTKRFEYDRATAYAWHRGER